MTERKLTENGLLDPRLLESCYQEAMQLTIAFTNYLESESGSCGTVRREPSTEIFLVNESLRASTCLMQVVSWFLVQKGIVAGEMTKSEAGQKQRRLGAHDVCLAEIDDAGGKLPPSFIDYFTKAQNLYRRVARMDELIYGRPDPQNPVHALIRRIENGDPSR